MKQTFRPQPGFLAVVREKYTLKSEAGIVAPEDVVDQKTKVNPWAFVVGVGENTTGKPFGIKPGDKVLMAEIGRHVELIDSDGNVDFIYVLPFQGIMGRLEFECEKCGARFDQTPPIPCPSCPVIEKAGSLDTGTLKEIAEHMRKKGH